MRKAIIFGLGVLVLGLAVVVIRGTESPQKNQSVPTKTQEQEQKLNKYKTQTNSEGEVSVEINPLSLSSKEDVRFNIVLNTHSVALEKDLKNTSVLVDDKGNEYKPISWDGGTGGHHLEGILIFPKLLENAKSAKLTIRGIADINRNFEWEL